MAYTQVYRSTWSRALGVGAAVFAGGALASLAIGSPDSLLRYAAPLALLGAVGWLAYWRPRVVLDESGVTVHNVFRSVHLPWAGLREVHSRYGLRLETIDGEHIDAWAVPAPVGLDRARAAQTEAAIMVRQRWERVLARGEDTLAPGEDPGPRITVEAWPLALTAGLLLCAIAGLLLG